MVEKTAASLLVVFMDTMSRAEEQYGLRGGATDWLARVLSIGHGARAVELLAYLCAYSFDSEYHRRGQQEPKQSMGHPLLPVKDEQGPLREGRGRKRD